jgi:hypothetical protein
MMAMVALLRCLSKDVGVAFGARESSVSHDPPMEKGNTEIEMRWDMRSIEGDLTWLDD